MAILNGESSFNIENGFIEKTVYLKLNNEKVPSGIANLKCCMVMFKIGSILDISKDDKEGDYCEPTRFFTA